MITLLKFPGQSIDKILENPNISHKLEKKTLVLQGFSSEFFGNNHI